MSSLAINLIQLFFSTIVIIIVVITLGIIVIAILQLSLQETSMTSFLCVLLAFFPLAHWLVLAILPDATHYGNLQKSNNKTAVGCFFSAYPKPTSCKGNNVTIFYA